MIAQPATKASASGQASGMNMVIIMSGVPRVARMTSAQAAAAIRSRVIEVTTVARSRTGAGTSRVDAFSPAEAMDAVYAGGRGEATTRRAAAALTCRRASAGTT